MLFHIRTVTVSSVPEVLLRGISCVLPSHRFNLTYSNLLFCQTLISNSKYNDILMNLKLKCLMVTHSLAHVVVCYSFDHKKKKLIIIVVTQSGLRAASVLQFVLEKLSFYPGWNSLDKCP